MNPFIRAISLVVILLLAPLSGCAFPATSLPPTTTSTPTLTSIPPTLTPTPTVTSIPSPTAVPPVWTKAYSSDSPYELSVLTNSYRREIITEDIIFDANTRWTFNVQVDNLVKDVGEASTGIILQGYTGKGEIWRFFNLTYQFGKWSAGYSSNGADAQTYWQTFENLTDPVQSFEISISKDNRNFAIKNDKGFEFVHEMPENLRLFADVGALYVVAQVGPYTKITLSDLIVEQLKDPLVLTTSTVSLEVPYFASFENLDINHPMKTSPFVFPNTSELALFVQDLSHMIRYQELTAWELDTRAYAGRYAINVIPHGNPSTKDLIPTTIAVLDPVFNVSGNNTVNLKMWINTTSNPRPKAVHNCDSALGIYYKTDMDAWTKVTVWCGEYKKESQGWQEISMDFDMKGKSTIQFAFMYEVQFIAQPDPSVYYLIDDLEITAK